jgi:oxygen-independent coproporphyrinogen-3 oxidase
VTEAWLEAVLALGVTRISLGVQALDDTHLAQLERRHGRAGAEAALDRLASAHARGALASFSVDLIYGLAGQTVPALDALVQRWSPPHLSLYMLTIEPRTVLARRIRDGRAPQPDDGLQIDMLFAARDRLATHGYAHYEVSSWARPGHLARHNAAYWDMRPYLGLGAGAHGFWGGRRWRNETRPSVYLARVEAGDDPSAESEHPDAATLAFERVMTGLRRLDIGLALGPDEVRFADAVAAELARGRLERLADRIRLTSLGLQMMDDVLLSFA